MELNRFSMRMRQHPSNVVAVHPVAPYPFASQCIRLTELIAAGTPGRLPLLRTRWVTSTVCDRMTPAKVVADDPPISCNHQQ